MIDRPPNLQLFGTRSTCMLHATVNHQMADGSARHPFGATDREARKEEPESKISFASRTR